MKQKQLTSEQVARARHSNTVPYAERLRDGRGLMLVLQPKGCGKSWILRIQHNGKRRDIGLGPCPEISLDMARELATIARREVKIMGLPYQLGRINRREEDGITSPLFSTVWQEYIDIRRQGWKGDASLIDWNGIGNNHVLPKFGKRMIHTIGSGDINNLLKPIWHSKYQTAKKVLGRVQQVMDYAAEMNYIEVAPSAGKSLGKSKIAAKHRRKLPVEQAPILYRWLTSLDLPQAKAMALIMLTACRALEIRGAQWKELNLKAVTLDIPAERMKMGNPHTVYLNREAALLIRMLAGESSGSAHLFNVHHMKLQRLRDRSVKDLGIAHYDIHGLRTTFAEWCEVNGFNDRASKACIAHATDRGADKAYYRGDGLIPERRRIMDNGGAYLSGRNTT